MQKKPRRSKASRSSRFVWLSSGLLFVFGCTGTREALEKKGVEVKSGKVMKVMRF